MGSLDQTTRTTTISHRHARAAALLACSAIAGCGEREVDVFTAEVDVITAVPAPPAAPVASSSPVDAGPEPEPAEPEPEPVMSGDILIDDFEDGDQQALATDGWWYVANDGTAQQYMEADEVTDRAGSLFALHSSGDGFTQFGAFIGLDLGAEAGVFDAGWTDAVRFWAKSANEREVIARFLLQDNSSLQTTIALQTEWTQYVIRFDEFRFEANQDARIDPSRLRHFQLFFGIDAFDVYLDDIEFLDL